MTPFLDDLLSIVTHERAQSGLRALVVLVLSIGCASLVRKRLRVPWLNPQQALLFTQSMRYAILGFGVAWVLNELGLNMSVLLGAAGVLTLAIGFASQTSASNLISGLFLIAEESFRVGDAIRVGEITGEVLSIDPLSVKLRTFDNLLVRIPNETMLKANVVNLTRFPIRRLDLSISIAYHADVRAVRELILALAEEDPCCLEEPRPACQFIQFSESGQELQLQVWVTKEKYVELRNALLERIRECFVERGIETAYPRRSLAIAGPLQVSLVPGEQTRTVPETDPPG